MLNRVTRSFAVVALCLAPAVAAAPSNQGGGGDGCARVSISIQTGTATVAPGTTVGIAGSVNNCSSRKVRYTIDVVGTTSCGQKSDIVSKRLALAPGENTMYTISYPVPWNACTGPFTANVQVRDNASTLATADTTIQIQ